MGVVHLCEESGFVFCMYGYLPYNPFGRRTNTRYATGFVLGFQPCRNTRLKFESMNQGSILRKISGNPDGLPR